MSEETDENFKIPHQRANSFHSAFANGVTVSLSPSGYYNMTFWEDAMGIVSETARLEDGVMETSYESDDVLAHREDKFRITIDLSTMRALHDVLDRRLKLIDGDEE